MAKPINLINGDEMCCGTLCPKTQVQDRIDDMQRVINAAHQHINYGGLPMEEIVELMTQLEKLHTS